jgi:hypothetical protein
MTKHEKILEDSELMTESSLHQQILAAHLEADVQESDVLKKPECIPINLG